MYETFQSNEIVAQSRWEKETAEGVLSVKHAGVPLVKHALCSLGWPKGVAQELSFSLQAALVCSDPCLGLC